MLCSAHQLSSCFRHAHHHAQPSLLPTYCASFLAPLIPHCMQHTQVDIIFDDSYTVDSSNLLDMAAFTAAYGPQAATLPAVVAGKVYAFNNKLAKSSDDTVSTDWFEAATARPDLVSPLAPALLSPCAHHLLAAAVYIRIYAERPGATQPRLLLPRIAGHPTLLALLAISH